MTYYPSTMKRLLPLNKESPIQLYSLAFITVSLSSGLVYGYPHLRNNLLANGSNLTESQLGIVYTVGSWTVHGGRFFSGIARDRYGTRNVATLCLLSATCGTLGLAFSNEKNTLALSISFFLVGLGSGGQLCLQPVAGLFPKKWQGTVLASLSGAFQISGLVYLVLKNITENRKVSYGYFALLLGIITICLWFVLPKTRFEKKEEIDEEKPVEKIVQHYSTVSTREEKNDDLISESCDEKGQDRVESAECVQTSSNEMYGCHLNALNDAEQDAEKSDNVPTEDKGHKLLNMTDTESMNIIDHEKGGSEISTSLHETMKPESDEVKDITAKQEKKNDESVFDLMKSIEYILLLLWFTIMLIPQQYYIGTIAFQLERKGDDDGRFVNIFSILYASAALISPALGKIADIAGLGVAQLIATIFTMASMFILNSPSLDVHAVGMALYGIGRMTTFGMFFTNVGKRFGFTHYGTLVGFGLLVSAIFSLLQYPLIDAAANGYEFIVNLISAFVLLGTCVPYCIWLGRKEKMEKNDHR